MSSDTLYPGVSRVQSFPPPPTLTFHLPRSLRESQQSSSKPHINPSVLVIVIILSVVFFCSGILHILARCLGRRRAREPPGGLSSPSISIRGQLQQLFSLHDSGVDQVFIDTLPVFLYGSIRGLKESADCAVCLNEFANEDKLRLLPKCKHAFHTECIDTWLLSNSTCPLCRRSLLPEAEPILPPSEPASCAAVLPQEEQEATQPQPSHGSFRGSFRASLRGSFRFLTDAVAPPPPPPSERETAPVVHNPNPPPSTEIQTLPMTPGPTVCVTEADGSEKMLRVELGKVNSFDSRRVPTRDVGTSRMPRSYSMGSYEYVVDFSTLGLPIPLPSHHSEDKSPSKPTHRSALSDSIPELASASHTPGQEDMFWASRGLATPHSLSRVREIMTPSPGWCSSPLLFESQNIPPSLPQQEAPGLHLQQVVNIDHNQEEHGEIEVANAPAEHKETEMVEERSLSLRDLVPLEKKIEARSLQRSSTLDNAGMEKMAAAARMEKLWDVSVDVPDPPTSIEGTDRSSSSSKKLSPLNWLRGSFRRNLVYSAASPSSTDMQSTEAKNTTGISSRY